MRTLLDEQLYAKSRAVEMAGRVIRRWDANKLRSMVRMFPVDIGPHQAPQNNAEEVPPEQGIGANPEPEDAARDDRHDEEEMDEGLVVYPSDPTTTTDHNMEWAPSSDDE